MGTPDPRGPARLLGFALHFVLVGALLPQALEWDGIGFLQRAAAGGPLELGHALYAPLVALARTLASPLGVSLELAGRLVSAAGGAALFVLLWRRAERTGMPGPLAVAAALALSTAPLPLRMAGVIEPSTASLAVLLLGLEAAEAYGRAPGARRLALLLGALVLALGLHLAAVLSLPWLLWHARGADAQARRALVALVLALLGTALATGLATGALGELLVFARGFLPTGDPVGALVRHGRHGLGVLVGGAPLALALGLPAALLAARPSARHTLAGPLLLGLPHLVVFLVAGKPVAALLLPVLLAFALAGIEGLARLPRGAARRVAGAGLALAVGLQSAVGVREAFHLAAAPDRQRDAALLYAAALPEGALLVAGPLAHHLEWFTDAPVLALPELLHGARGRAPGDFDAAEAVHAALAERGAPGMLTDEGRAYLEHDWGASLELLAPDEARAIRVRDDPALSLVPLRP